MKVGRKSNKKLDSLAEQLRAKGAPVMETGQEVWLAGLGALSVARKKGEKVAGKGSKMFDRLVAEGQKVEKKVGKTVRSDANEAAERISGAAGKAKSQAKKTADKVKGQAKKTATRAKNTAAKAKSQAKKTVAKAKGQSKKTVVKARGQAKKTTDKAKTQAKKAATKATPKPTGPVTLHLVPKDDEWAVRLEGSEEDLSLHSTKQLAVKAARGIARAQAPSHLIVHRADGTVQESFSYD